MKEARNAQADKQRGVLDNAGAQFDSNAAARCDVLAGEEKAACQARVIGLSATPPAASPAAACCVKWKPS